MNLLDYIDNIKGATERRAICAKIQTELEATQACFGILAVAQSPVVIHAVIDQLICAYTELANLFDDLKSTIPPEDPGGN